jgi:hypothetical protein
MLKDVSHTQMALSRAAITAARPARSPQRLAIKRLASAFSSFWMSSGDRLSG